MRQRKVKNLEEKLAALSPYAVAEPKEQKGKWKEVFGNENPIYLELGCGKGKFLADRAAEDKEGNYIGIEGQGSVVVRAMEKAEKAAARGAGKNLRFCCCFINDIEEYFQEGELSGIYLNFSDPWPKAGHAKRRLTYYQRLLGYKRVIKQGGFIEIKTDNQTLFDFTLEQIGLCGMAVSRYSRNLHEKSSLQPASLFTTEYEEKFSARGLPICYVRILL